MAMSARSGSWRLIAFAALTAVLLALPSCQVDGAPADETWNDRVAEHRHFIDMGGYRMHYVDIGEGEPVVLVHGFADSTYCWHENLDALGGAGFRLILVDLPGLGQSEIPPESVSPSIDWLSGEVLRLADHLGLKKFSVAGNSMGGGISLFLALNHPERVKRAVPIDPACYRQRHSALLSLLSTPVVGDASVHLMGRWTVATSLKQVYFDDEKVTGTLIGEYARPIAKPGYKQYLARLIRAYFSPAYDDMIARYGEMKVPVLIVWGDHDAWVPSELAGRLYQDVPGSELLMVENAGHLPHQERPEIVNPRLVSFLSGKTKENRP